MLADAERDRDHLIAIAREVDAGELVVVAHACPSGAIRYERHDGWPAERSLPVNLVNVRENGPLAIRGDLTVAGEAGIKHATPCRCGPSGNKPYCESSHADASFVATSDPTPLAAFDGPLSVYPQRNGPLLVEGNLESCAGTGRAVARTASTKLCWCRSFGQQALLRRQPSARRLRTGLTGWR